MDVPRPRRPRRRWLIGAAAAAGVVAVAIVAAGGLRAAPPSVARANLWFGTVERGPMVRDVQANGTLVPEKMQWVTAVWAGRVERVLVRGGDTVAADAVLVELANPDLELQALEAERQVVAAQSELTNLRASLRSERLAQEGVVAGLETDLATARRKADANQRLDEAGAVSRDEVLGAAAVLSQTETRIDIEKRRLATMSEGMTARISAQENEIQRLQAIAKFRREQLASLKVTAGVAGVVQDMPLENGQWVTPGAVLARVAQPDRLEARLLVPESLAKDVTIGQTARIDLLGAHVTGRVSRTDANVTAGTVAVDVALEGALPKGARPDLNIVGTIELERLGEVLHVGRPAFVQPESAGGIFKVSRDGREAVRVNVRFGRASATTIEVMGGVAEGDVLVLSDMSAWDRADRLRIE
jgi:HlyD family secretion protein